MRHSPVRRPVKNGKGRVIRGEAQVILQDYWAKHNAFYKKVTPYRPLNGVRGEQAVQGCRAFEASPPQQRILRRSREGLRLPVYCTRCRTPGPQRGH